MNKIDPAKFFKNAKLVVTRHSPEILTGIGIAGMAGTIVMAVRATPKAVHLIETKKKEGHLEKLTPVETVQTTWKCYIPAAVTGITSVACLIGACSISTRRNAALVTAYNLSKTALDEYKSKVIETIGEKKEQTIREQIMQERIEKDPVSNHEVVMTGRGNTLCYDAVFGRYFMSDRHAIECAINKINRTIIAGDMYISLNEFYSEIGLSPVEIGDKLGWNLDDGEISLDFSSHLAENGVPALAFTYSVAPRYNFSRYL